MLNLAVFYNRKASIKPDALKIILELKQAGYKLTLEKISRHTQLVLALGGDGTFLRAAYLTKTTRLPLLAVNLGRIGFMGELAKTEVLSALRNFQKGKFLLDRRGFLQVTARRKNKILFTDYALNDVVFSRFGISRLFDIKVQAPRREVIYRADGIIISTPTGSTAYNLSAGGSILPPQTPRYILTPICPHLLNWCSILVDDNRVTTVAPLSPKKINLVLTYDGHQVKRLSSQDVTLEIKKSKLFVNFVRFKPYNFNKLFKSKFGR